ncbi:tetratricopeptide repeat protein [Balneicella halophila]|uniref:Tetratricopeptide repeat protein n=1 Tax=Balneicella halophila TaxID=1537566 RepID=A0A7L4UR50_BALHA|nr:tetratricopeptide repeat protein [Balneicella halophila]PVX51992.1 tetratricopeptide repeat protein [Balneicella halophila]
MKYKHILSLIILIASTFGVFAQDVKEDGVDKDRQVNYYLVEAKDALAHGNVQKAISIYNQCIAVDNTCATAHYELANIAIAVNDLEVALTHSRKAVAIAPSNNWFQLQLAEILESRGLLKQSAKAYAELAKMETQNPFYLQKSMMLYESSESWEEALKLYDVWEEQYGADFNMMARKQGLYSKAGKPEEGLAELKKLIKKEPKNSEYYSLLAMRYEEEGDEKKVAKTFEKITKLDTISGVANMMLARYYMGVNDYPNAYKALKGAIKSGEVDENANVAGVIGLLQADTTEQSKVYRDTLSSLLIDKYPENAIGYLFKAQEYGEAQDYEKSEKVLEKALDIDPTNYNGLAQMSIIHNIKQEWDELYELAKKGIEYYPQQHLFYLFKGLAASQKKEYAVAEASLTTGYLYAKDSETQEDIRELLADVYYKSGKKQKAFDLFEELLNANPDNVLILNNYAYFLSLENENLEKAEAMSRKTLEQEENNATYLDTYAWVLHQQGRYREALKYMEKAIKNLENEEASSEMWEHYGDILYKLGKSEQAKKEWRKALSLPDPETERLQEKIKNND